MSTNPLRGWLSAHRNYLLLAGTVFCLGGAFGVQLPLFANFIYERFGVHTHEYGYIEAIREMPGFLTAFVGVFVMWIAAPRLGALSLAMMGAGFAAYAWLVPISEAVGGSAILALILVSVFWSVGFHTWAPLEGTLGLRFSPPEQKGRWLGWLRTTMGIGQIAMMGLSLLLISLIEYEGMFLIAGGLLILGAALIRLAKPTPGQERNALPEKRILLKKRYSIYYALTFLVGARKQIFLMFAVWLLVREHGASRETILLLMIVNQIVSLLLSPTVGKLVDRFGERITLTVADVCLIGVFLGYAFVRDVHVLYGLYIADNALYVGAIAYTTYLHKIAPKEDLRPTITMGVTMNHIPSVLVPLIGGLLWSAVGSTAVFLAGAGFVAVSLIVEQFIRPDAQTVPDLAAAEPAD